MVDANFFKRIFLFQDLVEAAMKDLLGRADSRDFTAGEVVIQEGEPGDSMFVMVRGEVEITMRLTLVPVDWGYDDFTLCLYAAARRARLPGRICRAAL